MDLLGGSYDTEDRKQCFHDARHQSGNMNMRLVSSLKVESLISALFEFFFFSSDRFKKK